MVCAPIFQNTCRVCSEVRQPVPALPSAHFGAERGEVAIRGTRLRAFGRTTAFSCWRGQLIRSAPWSFKCLSARSDPRGNWFAHLVARSLSLSSFLDSDPLSPNREQQPPAPLAVPPDRPAGCTVQFPASAGHTGKDKDARLTGVVRAAEALRTRSVIAANSAS